MEIFTIYIMKYEVYNILSCIWQICSCLKTEEIHVMFFYYKKNSIKYIAFARLTQEC